MAKSYLLGKFLVATDPEDGAMSLFRFKEQIGEDLWVIQPCCPQHGEELPVGTIIIDTHDLASHPCDAQPVAMIFDDMRSFQAVMENGDDEAEAEKPAATLLN